MPRKKIVAGNWKMNLSQAQGQALIKEIVAQASSIEGVELVLCPPFPHLGYAVGLLEGKNVFLGAQNCHQKSAGAYTGEVSASLLKSFCVSHVILGHSERREYFGEDNALLAQKTQAVLQEGLTPIFCCGESLAQRQNEDFVAIVCSQIREALFGLSKEDFAKIVIAYEPIWAIGTGVTASSAQAQEMHAALRNFIAQEFDADLAQELPILYGGSCKPDNAQELFACPDVDGGLIGGASLKAEDFLAIARAF